MKIMVMDNEANAVLSPQTEKTMQTAYAENELPEKTDTRDKIVSAVEECMRHKELSELTIREICKTAGISIGAFYLYFPCKEAALLYVYRQADRVFTQLVLRAGPLENIRQIMDAYLHMVNLDNLPIIRQIYICHIKYCDPYFFDENRPVFVILREQTARLVSDTPRSKELVWKLLTYARGLIFHACCQDAARLPDDWHKEQLKELMTFLESRL